jgi:hypothetical protein
MITISVTGATSNVGKTTLIEHLLRKLPGTWGVCKVTICAPGRKHRCPHGKEESCGICSEDLQSFVAETADAVLKAEGKDTRRYYDAGADRVVWVRSREEALREGVEAALRSLSGERGIIFEGNHALEVLDADVAVMVSGRPARYKASAKKILHKIDIHGEASDPKLIARIVRTVEEKENNG